MDQGSATADLTLSINCLGRRAEVERLKQFRQLSFSDRMRQQWLEKVRLGMLIFYPKPVRDRNTLPGLCAYGLPVYAHTAWIARIRLAGLCIWR